MTAPSKVSGSPRAYRAHRRAPVEVVEESPSIEGRLARLAARLTLWPALAGVLDVAARTLLLPPGTVRATIRLPRCPAQLVRAAGVLPADGTRRVVLYLHGDAFLRCGAHANGQLVTRLSKYADSPVLVVQYRMIPQHSIHDAIDDCYDAYQWLRRQGYRPEQIVLAGDSAGGYLALALANRLLDENDEPAAIVAMSPLLQLARAPGVPKIFDEPLDHVNAGLPPTLIHVSGSEELLHDTRLAADKLTAAGVAVQVRVWPGQIHAFQIAAPFVPEAARSLRQIGSYIRDATG